MEQEDKRKELCINKTLPIDLTILSINRTKPLIGFALAWMQQVLKPVDLWDITFCTCGF